MRRRSCSISCSLISLLAVTIGLSFSPARADTVVYDNGPDLLNKAGNIGGTYAIADDFVLSNPAVLTGVTFSDWVLYWENAPTSQTIAWSIRASTSYGLPGSPTYSGDVPGPLVQSGSAATPSATFNQTVFWNYNWYNVYNVSFSLPNVSLAPGHYWLTLNSSSTYENTWGMSNLGGRSFYYLNYPENTVYYGEPYDQSFSLTSAVPLPSAAWSATACLSLLAVTRIWRRKRAAPVA